MQLIRMMTTLLNQILIYLLNTGGSKLEVDS